MSDRRTRNDRRVKRSRRRRDRRGKGYDSYTVIEIVGGDLRVVTLSSSADESPDKVKAISIPWRVEATVLNSDKGLAELTDALQELAEKHELQTTNLQFVLGGEFCVTKAVRGTTEEVRSELQQIEQRSRLYLMLGPGEKVTVSKSQAIDARHQNAVAAVCNKQTLDTIHEAATRAGMQIDSIEPALVSTSRAIGRLKGVPNEPCLLIHLDGETVELGVCHDGSLLLDYRPGGCTDPEALVELVRTHLSRLQRHVGRQLRQPPPQLQRIYLSGEKPVVDRAFEAFATGGEFDVEKVDPSDIQATWEFDEAVQGSAAIPALGALLSTYLPSSERDVPNFMDHIVAITREPLKPILVRSSLPAAAVLLVAVAMFAFNLTQQSAIDEVQQQLDGLATIQVRDRELRLQKDAAQAKLIQLRKLAERIPQLPAGKIVARVGHCMPSDVWLSRLEVDSSRKIQLVGASYLEAGVFDFVRWLDQAPGFEDVALRSTRPGHSAAGPAINFTVELNLGDWNGQVEEVARNE